MSITDRLVKYLVLGLVAAGVGLIAVGYFRPPKTASRVKVQVPMLSSLAKTGSVVFERNCAQCHGGVGGGTSKGPPLVHRVYRPGHHADAAFLLAARQGVRQHHWQFGDMPAQPEMTDEQMAAIVRFVREVQAANGIGNRPSQM